jgi:hypothetical protein
MLIVVATHSSGINLLNLPNDLPGKCIESGVGKSKYGAAHRAKPAVSRIGGLAEYRFCRLS